MRYSRSNGTGGIWAASAGATGWLVTLTLPKFIAKNKGRTRATIAHSADSARLMPKSAANRRAGWVDDIDKTLLWYLQQTRSSAGSDISGPRPNVFRKYYTTGL